MTVYVDLVMALNFLVDFLLLLGTNRLSGFPSAGGRCALAAAFGAVYSGACLFPGFRFLGGTLWRLVSLGIMGTLAFGMNMGAVRRCGIFLILSMALGGIALCYGKGQFAPVLLCTAVLWGLCRLGFGGSSPGTEYVPITITHGGKQLRLLAIRDTGNTLRDPVTGEPVLVLSAEAAQKLTGFTLEQLRSPVETLARHPGSGLRLVPYKAVGSTGMLLAMRFENVTVGNRRQSAIAAFAAEEFGRGEAYQALTGGAI